MKRSTNNYCNKDSRFEAAVNVDSPIRSVKLTSHTIRIHPYLEVEKFLGVPKDIPRRSLITAILRKKPLFTIQVL